MIRPSRSRLRAAGASLAAGAAIALAGAPAAGAQELDVVADGLSNPRGLAFGPGGHLYVAESGRGGPGACFPGPEGDQCYGETGAITRVNVRTGRQREIAGALPSVAGQAGETAGADAVGPQDISFRGRIGYFTVGLAANPAVRTTLGAGAERLAGLYRIGRTGRVRRVADLGAFEAERNPDAGQPGAQVDTNPYSVDASVRGEVLVTDAGGNDLLQVDDEGDVEVLATFPFGQTLAPPFLGLPPGTQIPYQPVPTGVTRNARGDALVGQLTGFPFPAGAANVYRVRGASAPVVLAGGFTTIIDVAAGPRGSVYVLQLTSNGLASQDPGPGKLVRITRGGRQIELAKGRLQRPSGLVVARNGDVYVSNQGSSPSDGEIVRIPARR